MKLAPGLVPFHKLSSYCLLGYKPGTRRNILINPCNEHGTWRNILIKPCIEPGTQRNILIKPCNEHGT